MGQRSSIKRDPKVHAAVQEAIKRGATIDQIVEHLHAYGHDEISRSAVGRFAKSYREIADRERDIQIVAQTYSKEFGDDENLTGKVLIQLATSLATRVVLAQSEGKQLDFKDIQELGSGVKGLIGAANLDADRDEKIRKRARDEALAEAAEASETIGKRAGASAETIHQIKRELLGLRDA